MELDKIIKILIENSCITSNELARLGYIDEDINELISDGYIKRREKGIYVLGKIDTLLLYAHSIENRNEDLAKDIFDYCNLINSNNLKPYYERFYKSIEDNNYDNIFKYFKLIDEKTYNDLNIRKTNNFYLLLLSYLYSVPEEYFDRVENINLEDILLDDNNPLFQLENKLKKDLFFKAYHEAKKTFERKKKIENDITINEKIENKLVSSIIEKYEKTNEKILSLISNNRLFELRELLYKENETNFLNMKNSYLLKTTIDYLDIKKSKKLPKIKEKASNTFEAIRNNDYRMALSCMEKFGDKKNVREKDPLYLMLIKINELYNDLDESKKKEIVEDMDKKIDKEIEEIEPVFSDDNLETKYKKRIDKGIEKIQNGKILLILDNIDSSKCEEAVSYVNSFKNVTSFIIGEGDKAKVVLRSKPPITEVYNFSQVVADAKIALYVDRNYKRAEELYKILLQYGIPRDFAYGEYGLTLLKLHRKKEAIPYLKIATELSRIHGGKIDYSDLIITLDGTLDKNEIKPRVYMMENDFHESKTFNLELDYLDDLVNLVLEDEIDLEDAMTRLNLNEENKNFIRLICARDCYYQKKYKEGDKYILAVERSNDKTNNVKRILKQVKDTKKYYKNRFNKDEENQLVFRK